jgi:hypothetical protein
MKGIVFNIMERAVSETRGEDAWDQLLDAAGLQGAYTSLGNYPHADFMKLVEAAAADFDMTPRLVLRWIGRAALPEFARRYPELFSRHRDARSFVLTLNSMIHPEVRKLYPEAGVPVFDFDTSSEDVLVIGYRSRRRLCGFGEGLLDGTAAHYGERAAIERPECVLRGDERCVFAIRFSK